MDIVSGAVRAPEAPARSLETLVSELAEVLTDGNALYVSLGPKGAVMSVKAPEGFAFGGSVGGRWARMGPRERADFVLGWVRRAAKTCRKRRSVEPLPPQVA